MRSWAPRLGAVAFAVPVIAVVSVSAAEAPDGDASASTAVTVADAPTTEVVAPPNATPPNPDAEVEASNESSDRVADDPAGAAPEDESSGGQGAQDDGRKRGGDGKADGPGGAENAKGTMAGQGSGGQLGLGCGRANGGGAGRAGAGRPTAAPRDGSPGPAATWQDAPEPDPESCPTVPRAVVVDRTWQRAWLCGDGQITGVFPITTARDQPDPGDYPIYARDWQSFSDTTPQRSWLDRFIAFTHGKYEGLRIGFHAVPYYEDGTRIQPFDSVGSQGRFGDSDGCIRVLPEHAELLWGYLQEGDIVRVLT